MRVCACVCWEEALVLAQGEAVRLPEGEGELALLAEAEGDCAAEEHALAVASPEPDPMEGEGGREAAGGADAGAPALAPAVGDAEGTIADARGDALALGQGDAEGLNDVEGVLEWLALGVTGADGAAPALPVARAVPDAAVEPLKEALGVELRLAAALLDALTEELGSADKEAPREGRGETLGLALAPGAKENREVPELDAATLRVGCTPAL